MKQVFPRFLRPTTPLELLVVIFMSIGLFSSSSSANSQYRRWNLLSFSFHSLEQYATFSHWQGNFSSAMS
jgi:hypothetical protein